MLQQLENGHWHEFQSWECKPLVLGLSWSTQGVAAALFDPDTGVIAMGEVSFAELPQFEMPQGYQREENGKVVTSVALFLEALDRVLSEISTNAGPQQMGRIRYLTGNVQQHGAAFLRAGFSEALKALNPQLALFPQLASCFSCTDWPIWMSSHTEEECGLITEAFGGPQAVALQTGSPATPRFSLALWLSFARSCPDLYSETAVLSQFSGFLTSLFACGIGPLEPGNGLGSNAMNHQGRWCTEALANLEHHAPNLRRRLPPITHSLDVVGQITPYFAKRFGIHPDCCVLPFTGDNPESALGTGLYSPTQGEATYSFGTSLTKFRIVDSEYTHVASGEGHIFGAVSGGNLMLVCHANGMALGDRLRVELGRSWSEMQQLLRETAAGNEGVWAVLLPERECTPPIKEAVEILSDQQRFMNDPAVRYRALCESQACLIALSEELPGAPQEIIATGGASADLAFLQVVADVSGKSIRVSAIKDSTTLGSALRAARLCSAEYSFSALTKQHCKTGAVLHPEVAPEHYRLQLEWFQQKLNEITTK